MLQPRSAFTASNFDYKTASPRLIPSINQLVHLVEGLDGTPTEILHVGAIDGVFTNPQVALAVGVQEVTDPFAVDLHVGNLKGEGGRGWYIIRDCL